METTFHPSELTSKHNCHTKSRHPRRLKKETCPHCGREISVCPNCGEIIDAEDYNPYRPLYPYYPYTSVTWWETTTIDVDYEDGGSYLVNTTAQQQE